MPEYVDDDPIDTRPRKGLIEALRAHRLHREREELKEQLANSRPDPERLKELSKGTPNTNRRTGAPKTLFSEPQVMARDLLKGRQRAQDALDKVQFVEEHFDCECEPDYEGGLIQCLRCCLQEARAYLNMILDPETDFA
jgi:hypothetical protein